jgi:hypothetical protein
MSTNKPPIWQKTLGTTGVLAFYLILAARWADTLLSVWIRGCIAGDIPRSWNTI